MVFACDEGYLTCEVNGVYIGLLESIVTETRYENTIVPAIKAYSSGENSRALKKWNAFYAPFDPADPTTSDESRAAAAELRSDLEPGRYYLFDPLATPREYAFLSQYAIDSGLLDARKYRRHVRRGLPRDAAQAGIGRFRRYKRV